MGNYSLHLLNSRAPFVPPKPLAPSRPRAPQLRPMPSEPSLTPTPHATAPSPSEPLAMPVTAAEIVERTIYALTNEGARVLEDFGVKADYVHMMTRDDIMNGNVDLIHHAARLLAGKKARRAAKGARA